MSWFVYIRKQRVYIPSAAMTSDGILVGIEPVEMAPINDMDALKYAVQRLIARGRKPIAPMKSSDFECDPILEAAGVKSWSTFYKGTRQLIFMRGEIGFEIVRLIPYGQGERGYKTDEATRIKLPGDLPMAQVVERIVEEIQREP